MKSALFVDFDNVYTQLRQVQPVAAERFARQPTEWLRWLIESLENPVGHDPNARRRMLVRRCYLNPNWYQTYRHAFLRAGFEIVDCPPVTAQGKTSTDIHMVLDIIELLQHETRYDEFIVFSADADFTPVLRKLRRYDRRTSVLAIGFPSAAYQASADLVIDERQFIEQALGLSADTPEAPDILAPGPETAVPRGEHDEPASPAAVNPAATPTANPTATPADLARIAQRILQCVAQSAGPLPAGPLALRLRKEFAPLLDHWNGHLAFKPFYRSLGLDTLVWLNGSGGRLADPSRHSLDNPGPGEAAAPADRDLQWAGHEAVLDVVREVCTLTGAPLLPPPAMHHIVSLLAQDLALRGYEPTETAHRIHEACLQRPGLAVTMRDVVFILRGLQLNGHVFGRGQDDVATLGQRLINQMLFLCEREQMVLGDAAVGAIRRWIAGVPANPA